MAIKKGVLFFGGDFEITPRIRKMAKGATVIGAANGGTKHALKLGYEPTFVVGDLDSISEATIGRLKQTDIYPYAPDKNKSDSELALEHMLSFSPRELIILGALGGRFDHALANLHLLSTIPSSIDAKILIKDGEIYFTKKRLRFVGDIGDIVSILPEGRRGARIKMGGFYYSLDRELLKFGSHGLSNRMTQKEVSIEVFEGALYLCHYFKEGLGR
jgi:thiamine pyrophosphokinase